MGFLPSPIFQPSPPTRFPLITAIGMCHFLPVHHFGMACLAGSMVNIQQLRIQWGSDYPSSTQVVSHVIVSAESGQVPLMLR